MNPLIRRVVPESLANETAMIFTRIFTGILISIACVHAEASDSGINFLDSPPPNVVINSSQIEHPDLPTCERLRLQHEKFLTGELTLLGGGIGYCLPYLWLSGGERAGASALTMVGGMAIGYGLGLIEAPSWTTPCDESRASAKTLAQARTIRENGLCEWHRDTYLYSMTIASAFVVGLGTAVAAAKAYPTDEFNVAGLFGAMAGFGIGWLGGYLLGDWILPSCRGQTNP